MKALLISVFGLMVLDAALTYKFITLGYADEANPLLKNMMHNHPEITCALIIIIALFLTCMLWQHRNKTKHIYPLVIGLLITKVAVIINHLYWMISLNWILK